MVLGLTLPAIQSFYSQEKRSFKLQTGAASAHLCSEHVPTCSDGVWHVGTRGAKIGISEMTLFFLLPLIILLWRRHLQNQGSSWSPGNELRIEPPTSGWQDDHSTPEPPEHMTSEMSLTLFTSSFSFFFSCSQLACPPKGSGNHRIQSFTAAVDCF